MIETLISSKTRVKLLLKFFLNSDHQSYLRGLTTEFGESSNAIRLELNRLQKAGMLVCELKGNKKLFKANKRHPLFGDIHNIVLKQFGIDQIIENVVKRLAKLEAAYLVGELAMGQDSKIVDLVFIGDIEIPYLVQLIAKAEKLTNKKIRYIIYDDKDDMNNLQAQLLLWSHGTKALSENLEVLI